MIISDIEKEKIYRDYHGKIYAYILSRINDTHNAEDLTSEVFVKVYNKLDTFDESRASLSTWIYTISKNTLTDYFRTRKVFEEIPETQEDGVSVEEEVCNAEMLDALATGLESLEERERDIIVLRFYSGKTLKEISAQMGISYAYIKVLQNKAFEKLRFFLDR